MQQTLSTRFTLFYDIFCISLSHGGTETAIYFRGGQVRSK